MQTKDIKTFLKKVSEGNSCTLIVGQIKAYFKRMERGKYYQCEFWDNGQSYAKFGAPHYKQIVGDIQEELNLVL